MNGDISPVSGRISAAKKFGFDKQPLKNEAPSAGALEPQ
jgi:hypothetical protein